MDWTLVKNVLTPPDGSDGAPFELCAATRDDWKCYVQSEEQALKSRRMAWWDDKVFIVELPGALHENLVGGVQRAITVATGTGSTHLDHHGAAFIDRCSLLSDGINDLLAYLEPDASFGPFQCLPGAVIPRGFTWDIFHTLKVEIGVHQGWGPPIDQQEQKAHAWRQCPGVQYVLCIRVGPRLDVREYRLDSIVDGQFEDPDMQHAPIDDNTAVQLDAWRLLGIPHRCVLRAGFNNPVCVNLCNVVDPVV
ncbi:hypothetical protein PHYSODRAFT_494738 [Phytophthora sojae]|uniref:Restriction endonuclease domain-containing protein n=1 Tax=Phytophthora sojae (strain P6497) TaxID=1094619 RepID=G4Z6P5_PHYSP|nr:hypothetical protein PHYSODRAFT_494738 [Phytophthora sojae]EGZ20311.1 hypothetical protein PHYSODRAFT_494738 [Phytophthora sojae]|eukprot:XP_009523028.1 hypothetical protein PHYSODRAFT_494738 [Phytophthora sojae]